MSQAIDLRVGLDRVRESVRVPIEEGNRDVYSQVVLPVGRRNNRASRARQELKELARSGRLKPTDRVRKDGMANWARAIQVKGLFEPQRPTTQAIPGFAAQAGPVLAPVPQSRDAPDPVFASAPTPGPLLGAPKYGQPIQGARSLKANIWRAVQLVTRKSKELKLAKISLPKAYAMLGQEVYRSNRFRPDLTDDYVRIDELQQKLKCFLPANPR